MFLPEPRSWSITSPTYGFFNSGWEVGFVGDKVITGLDLLVGVPVRLANVQGDHVPLVVIVLPIWGDGVGVLPIGVRWYRGGGLGLKTGRGGGWGKG